MGGGNGNKAMLQRERNAKKTQKKGSGVNQKEAAAKAMTIICQICRTGFMGTSNEATLRSHSDAKHPKESFERCFPDWNK